MARDKAILWALLFLLSQSFAADQTLTLLSPATERSCLYGVANPAGLSAVEAPDFAAALSLPNSRPDSAFGLTVLAGAMQTGFAVDYRRADQSWDVDFRFSRSIGNRTASAGIGIGWSATSTGGDVPGGLYTGILLRPLRLLSVGAVSNVALGDDRFGATFALGIRPLANEWLSLWGDWEVSRDNGAREEEWGVALATEPVRGVRVTARWDLERTLALGLDLGLGRGALGLQSRMDTRSSAYEAVYALRAGAYEPSVPSGLLGRRSTYMELDLHTKVKYRPEPYFDESLSLLELLNAIEVAKRDPAVAGIAVKASEVTLGPQFTWEIREKLRDFQASGKKVVVYLDKGEMYQYYLVSMADRIVLDPQGSLMLRGMVSGATFYRGTLDKVGVGFDEWRFLKYKAGFENYGRDSMSEGAREQRQAILDDLYGLVRGGICDGRGIATDTFDNIINKTSYLLPQQAITHKLADTIGRWEAVKAEIEKLEGGKRRIEKLSAVAARRASRHDRWGEPPRIALIYALGACAMDRGIKARKLVEVVRKATRDPRVKAMVLRVDSPGGDPMASDIVAEAVLACTRKKPVVVSQGAVAASGGYWLSMYADTIVAGAATVTGSIGVIGGWVYNAGIKEKLGMTTDRVQIGEHADLPFGFGLPLVGTVLPDRNLTEEERTIAETAIMTMYHDFVGKVAGGRGMDTAEVEDVAQGRVWTGLRARELGLVDELGGLDAAIRIAAARAGIPDPFDCTVAEAPRKKLSVLALVLPSLAALREQTEASVDYLHLHLEHNGRPLVLLPAELW